MNKRPFLVILVIIVIGLTGNQLCLSENKVNTVISTGLHIFPDGITVKKDEVLIIEPGAHLKMGEAARILVKGKIIAKGTKRNPIIFSGNNGYWRGIKIEGSKETPDSGSFWRWMKEGDKKKENFFLLKIQQGNIFEYCRFKNISTKEQKLFCVNKRKGALEIYNSSVAVTNSKFKDILHIAGVLCRKSYVLAANNSFITDTIHKSVNITQSCVAVIYQNNIIQSRVKNQTCADGIWIIGSTALVVSNNLKGIGDDGIDIKGSHSIVIDNKINNVWDEGVDLEGGINFVIQNSIKNSNESGIMVTESKKTILAKNSISGTKTGGGLTLRNGAVVVASEIILKNSNVGILFRQITPLALLEADFNKIKQQILNTSQEEIAPGSCNSLTPNHLIDKLESAYIKEGNYYFYNLSNFDGLVEEAFKTVKFEPKTVDIDKVKNFPLYSKQKNSLYLADSKLENNEEDFLVKDFLISDNFLLNIKQTEFTDKKSKAQVKQKCTAGFKPQNINELEVSSIISNANRIIQILNLGNK